MIARLHPVVLCIYRSCPLEITLVLMRFWVWGFTANDVLCRRLYLMNSKCGVCVIEGASMIPHEGWNLNSREPISHG